MMLSGLPSLIDSIFGKQDLTSVSLDEIRDVIAEFPSFNAAHYLLSKKLKQQDDNMYEKQSMRTALYFNNALWLQTILENEEQEILKTSKTDFIPKILSEYEDSETADSLPDFVEPLAVPESVKFENVEPVLEYASVTETVLDPAEENYSAPVLETEKEYVSEYGIFEDSSVEGKYLDNDSFDRPSGHSHSGENHVDLRFESENAEDNETIVEQNIVEPPVEDSIDHDAEAFDRRPDQFVVNDESITDAATEAEVIAKDEVIPVSEQPVQPMKAFDAKNAESIVFAPYHMVDYFASQGIKLVLEDQPADSFGKQLKSFTDWLKVMKKVPAKTRSEKSDDKETDRIRHFASHSLEERDILTETMAEVLAKQGMYENAIALYQKLSLIYPPKSVYFASRIEQLKASLP